MASRTVQPVAPPVAGKSRKPVEVGTPVTDKPMRKTIDLGTIEDLRILSESGEVDTKLDPNLPAEELRKIYRAMILTRKLDLRMLAMQRQGEMGTFAPGFGQEATQIGQVYPLTKSDWFSPSYRSFGAQLWRGWKLDQLMLLWDGFFEGFAIPDGVNDLPFSIVIGSHVLPATGIAMGIRARGEDSVVVTNFGDGASSQGAVSEAFNFAAVFHAPVIFVLENNGWAISIPVEKQCGVKELARRGPAFGIPAIRVDGNDILAMIVATQQAVEHARNGKGPYLIETVTYRMSYHTTADDPKVYRTDEEVKAWEAKCPIARFEKYLKNKKVLGDEDFRRIADECEQEILQAREAFRAKAKAKPREVFDFMYEQLPPELERQKAEYFARLDRKGVE
ncbi:MAG TPA: pyruvate dehydrogenase (acetyl-transferring) E1 component subunit alpha [Phycisphaerales bacterium]|nr:pyruvate dehydrogenase (acetyl-transferring) E1 component subunit alpha [Phycisphaerales bacterium]HRQ75141.1 pyruvate dehydrogenase (acetyl-transferring) E1 component subunit alpha [Phycisphaerales bacterium]